MSPVQATDMKPSRARAAAMLVVDGDPTGRAGLVRAAEAIGHEVVSCDSIATAREAMASSSFALAIVDPALADGDGLELVAELRGLPDRCLVLVVSHDARARARLAALRAGADDYLSRGAPAADLIQRGDDLLRGLRQRLPPAVGRQPHDGDAVAATHDVAPSILLCGADEAPRAALRDMLAAEGYVVIVTESAGRAVLVAADRRPDAIVVMAHAVEDGNALATIRRLRADGRLRLVPCLFVPSRDDPGAEQAALESGADAAVADIATLLLRVGALLRTGGSRTAWRRPDVPVSAHRILLLAERGIAASLLGLDADGVDVVLADAIDEAVDCLQAQQVDCVIVRGDPGGAWVISACAALRRVRDARSLPLVVLGPRTRPGVGAFLGLCAGTFDVLDEAAPPALLQAWIAAAVRRSHVEQENRVIGEALRKNEVEAAESRASRSLADARAHMLADLDRKNAELQRVSSALRKLSVAVEQSPMGVAICDRAGRIEYANEKLLTFLGYGANELHGRRPRDFLAEVSGAAALAYLSSFESNGEGKAGREWRGELLFRRRDGGTRWALVSTAPVRDIAGNVTHYVHTQVDITQRREAEQALAANEERLALILETMAEGILVLEPTGRVAFVNSAAERILDLEGGGAPRLATLDGVPIEDDQLPPVRVLKTGHAVQGEKATVPRRDSAPTVVSINAAPLRNGVGEVVAVVQSITDITDVWRAQEALRLAESKYRAVIERMPAIAYTASVEPDGSFRLRYISPQVERLLGLDPVDCLTQPRFWEDLLVDEDRVRLAAELAAVPHGERLSVEQRCHGAGGRIIWMSNNAVVVKDATGKPASFEGVLFDINERKAAEARLETAESHYRLLVEKLPTVVWQRSATPPYELVYISPRVEQLLGYTPEEMLAGPEANTWRHPDDRDRVSAALLRAAATAEPTILEYRVTTRDGRELWISNECAMVRDEAGEPLFLQGVIADITAQKHAKEALVLAKSEAERAAAVKSRFLSTMSHELRTPLNAILGFARVLDKGNYGPLNDRQQLYLRDIVQAGDHMLKLVDDLLDLQRVSEGRDLVTLASQPIDPVIQDAIRMVQPLAADKGHRLTLEVPDALPPAVVDRRSLLQILVNILTNAVKFTPVGGAIQLRARHDGELLTVAIEDDGIGIAPEDQARIFDYFEQVGGKHTHHMSGSGIGLALTRALVHRQGGSIWVASSPGKGSTFSFTLRTAEKRLEEPS